MNLSTYLSILLLKYDINVYFKGHLSYFPLELKLGPRTKIDRGYFRRFLPLFLVAEGC